jgi:hypothetical protein
MTTNALKLLELQASLKPGAMLFGSIPTDTMKRVGTRGGAPYFMIPRLGGATVDLAALRSTWRRYGRDAGYVESDHSYRLAAPPREKRPWLANVWRK